MRREEATRILSEHADRIRSMGVWRLALFGSTARDEAGRESDVDVLVDLDETKPFSLVDLAALELFLSDLLGRDVEVARRTTLRPYLRDAILADAVEIFPEPNSCRADSTTPMPPRSPRQRLQDMLDAIVEIESFVRGETFASFSANALVREAVERDIEIISEASRHLPDRFTVSRTEIPWREIAGIGNVLRHGYDVVEPGVLWTVATRDLEPLRRAVEAMIADVDNAEGRG